MSESDILPYRVGGVQAYCIRLAKEVGSINAAILYAYIQNALCSAGLSKESVKKDGKEWVSVPIQECKHRTALTYNQQKVAIKKLVDAGFVEVKMMQFPQSRWFAILK